MLDSLPQGGGVGTENHQRQTEMEDGVVWWVRLRTAVLQKGPRPPKSQETCGARANATDVEGLR